MKLPLKQIGKLNYMIYNLPGIGEKLLRGQSRAAAYAAFYAPFLGGKKCGSVKELIAGWKSFLNKSGIELVVTAEDKKSFIFEVGACPYGYVKKEECGACDAAMDLDRTYLRLLGGKMEILETIPGGASKCKFRVILQA
jgi:predicted ArsR family transcriptional regulator